MRYDIMEPNHYGENNNYSNYSRHKSFNPVWILVIGAFALIIICLKKPLTPTQQEGQVMVDNQNVTYISSEEVLRAIGELSTYECEYVDIVDVDNTRKIADNDILGTKRTDTIAYSGVIKVGYDFSSIEVSVDNNSRIIHITLPQEKVTDNYIDIEQVKVHEGKNILNRYDGLDEYLPFLASEKERHLQKAIDDGLFSKAEANAKTLIRASLNDFDGYTIDFIIRENNRL